MNKFLIVLLFALAACDMDIDAIMFQQFQKFIKKYHKKYNSVNEFLARYEVFRRNTMATFKEENSYRTGITKFSDLTQQEFAKTSMLLQMPGIGETKDMFLMLKIKDHADHAGLSQLLLT